MTQGGQVNQTNQICFARPSNGFSPTCCSLSSLLKMFLVSKKYPQVLTHFGHKLLVGIPVILVKGILENRGNQLGKTLNAKWDGVWKGSHVWVVPNLFVVPFYFILPLALIHSN